ncbi:YecA family protein [Aeromonas veronii]|uniref:YecA family protein n=1 Tax=Aeromonas veronii TaxID=654 RepID=A0A3A9HYA9_AERVE|nr:UPF0149 family protein [Aeromonas veronii]RKJ83725.1 YecA family protein [Aeromonas veronii]
MPPFESPSDNNELDELETLLEHYGSDHSIISMSMLDGFLTAIVSGPDLIAPGAWLPAIWGREQDQPQWQDHAEQKRFIDRVMRHYNDITTTLTYTPEDYFPLAPPFQHDGEWVVLYHEWCLGYLRGIELSPWPRLPRPQAAALAMICEVIEDIPREPEALDCDQGSRVCNATLALHAYFLVQRSEHPPHAQPAAASTRIDRNAPCPCGSGKKYKQCCLH